MNENTIPLMFALMRSALSGEKLSEEERNTYTKEILPELVTVARKHDLAHLIAHALEANSLTEEGGGKLSGEVFRAVYRYENMNYELLRICELLEAAKIGFLPLKGSVMRRYYREPWMRTSCDIDILVHPEDIDRAVNCLVSHGKFTNEGKGPHDISLFSPGGIHLELHYSLIEDDRANCAAQMLNTIWQYAVKRSGSEYHSELADEMFYYYHIAHMAKHFEIGGCGVRPFIDLWILDQIADDTAKEKRNDLLEKGRLLRFAECAGKLSRVWLGGEAHDSLTQQIENYILKGGVYGSAENKVILQQQKKGGKVKYIFSRLFLPYDVIKYQYPILQKHKWLTPLMEFVRFGRLLKPSRFKRMAFEFKYNANMPKSALSDTEAFLNNIGL